MTESLLKKSVIYGIGNFGAKFITFALVPIYTYFLSQEDLGIYDLIISVINLSIPVLTFQLSDAIFRWLRDENSELEKSILVSSIFLFIFGILVGVILLFLYFVHFVIEVEFSGYLAVMFFLNSFYILLLQTARGLGFSKLYALSGIVFSVFLLIANSFFLIVVDLKIEGLLLSNIVALSMVLVFILFQSKAYRFIGLRHFNASRLKTYLSYSLPLLPNTISWWAINTLTKFVILWYLGSSFNGLYAVSTKFATILYLLNSIFQLAWQERAIDEYNGENRNDYYNNVFQVYFGLQWSLVIVLIPLGKLLIVNFVDSNYSDAWRYLPILYISVVFQSLAGFLGTAYISSKKSIGAMKSSVLGAMVSMVLALTVIPYFGLYGAAAATMAGMFVLFFYRIKDTKRFFNITIPKGEFSLLIIGIVISTIGTFLLPFNLLYVFGGVNILILIFLKRSIFIKIFK